jgi:hypothetical protein
MYGMVLVVLNKLFLFSAQLTKMKFAQIPVESALTWYGLVSIHWYGQTSNPTEKKKMKIEQHARFW